MARKCSVERASQKTGGLATAKKHINIQYNGRERSEENLLNLIKKDALSHGVNDKDIEEVNVYIKPEEQAVYYVINQTFDGKIDF